MAIELTDLTFGMDNVDRTNPAVYTTDSFTAHANHLVLLAVLGRKSVASVPNDPIFGGTMTGTWTMVDGEVTEALAGDRNRIWLFRSLTGADRTGTVTIGPAVGEGWLHAAWSIVEFAGVDLSGTNGSGAIVQATSNRVVEGSGLQLIVPLGAFASSNNRPYMAGLGRVGSGTDYIPGTNFAEIHDILVTGETNHIFTAWAETVADTTADVSWSPGDVDVGAVAIELGAAVAVEILRGVDYPTPIRRRRPLTQQAYTVFAAVPDDMIPEVTEDHPCTIVYL